MPLVESTINRVALRETESIVIDFNDMSVELFDDGTVQVWSPAKLLYEFGITKEGVKTL